MNKRASKCILPGSRFEKRFLRQSKRRDRSSQRGIQRLIEEGEPSSVLREGSFIANGIGCPLSPTFVHLKYMIRDICSIE